MNTLIVVLIFSAISCLSAQPFSCFNTPDTTINPCDQTGTFTSKQGYACSPINSTSVRCTCPGSGFEVDRPCRLCKRQLPQNNVCQPSPRFIICLETTEYGGSYACLCEDPRGNLYTTTAADCNPSITVTSTISTTFSPLLCTNGGVFFGGDCDCPSGYTGIHCAEKVDSQLSARIHCKNGGVCAIRPPGGPYASVCLCRYGTSGDYCEITGTLGTFSAGFCLNGGNYLEKVVGTTRHAYCQCKAGYRGIKCAEPYFNCKTAGKYYDTEMDAQGKYFECTTVSGSLRLEHKSCPKGLRFSASRNICAY